MSHVLNDDMLKTAITEGNVGTVKTIIQRWGLHHSHLWYGGYTPLRYAVEIKKFDCAVEILKAGCNITCHFEKELEPLLHLAVNAGSLEFLRHLLFRKPQLNATNCIGETALHLAVRKSDVEIVSILLDAEADINLESESTKMKPFHIAVTTGNKRLIKLFLDRGIDINVKSSTGNTALHYACMFNSAAVSCKYLLENNSNINVENNGRETPLLIAIQNEYYSDNLIEMLLEHKVDSNLIGNRLAFELSLNRQNYDKNKSLISETMLKMGLILRREDIINIQIVTRVIVNNHVKVLEELLSLGLNTETIIRFKRFDGLVQCQTLLQAAIQLRYRIMSKILIHRGCNINVKDENGRTALFYAVKWSPELVNELIKHGADVNIKTDIGTTALHYAARCGHKKILSLLLNSKADVNCRSISGMTPVHYAAAAGQVPAIIHLASYGANLNARMKRNLTPLHLALMCGHEYAAQKLLSYDIDVNAQDIYGRTPLHIIASLGLLSTFRTITDLGADIYERDNKNRTPYKIMKYYTEGQASRYRTINDDLIRLYHEFTENNIIFCDNDNKPIVLESEVRNTVNGFIELAEFLNRKKSVMHFTIEELNHVIQTAEADDIFVILASEVKRMMTTNVTSDLTFYDAVSMNYKELAMLFRKQSLADEFKFRTVQYKYPCYCWLLKKHLAKSEQYYKMKMIETDFIGIFSKVLPDTISLEILKYFNNEDLDKLLQSVTSEDSESTSDETTDS